MSSGKIKDYCIYCKRKFTPEEFSARVQAKEQNAINSRIKAKANGNKVHRPRKINYDKIKIYRNAGWKIRKIAKFLEISTATVYRAIKEAK